MNKKSNNLFIFGYYMFNKKNTFYFRQSWQLWRARNNNILTLTTPPLLEEKNKNEL